MSPTSPSQLATPEWAGLQDLQTQQAIEGEQLDFKRELPQDNSKLAKTMCAFANSSGGRIIIGAEYDDKRTRCLKGFPGVQIVPSLDSRIEQIAMAIRPPIAVEVSRPIPVPGATERFVYTIRVQPGSLQPHMSSYDGRYWVRSASQSTFLPESIVEQMYVARRAKGEAVDEILREDFDGTTAHLPQMGGYWVTVGIIPTPPRQDFLLNCQALRDVLQNAHHYDTTGVYFLDTHFGYEVRLPQQELGELPPSQYGFLTRLYAHGLLLDAEMFEDSRERNGKVWMNDVRRVIRRAIALASKLYAYKQYAGFCRAMVRVSQIGTRFLTDPGMHVYKESVKVECESLTFHVERSVGDLAGEGTMESLMAQLQQSFGIPRYHV